MANLNVKISDEAMVLLKVRAAKQGKLMPQVVDELVKKHVK
jgi:hypothetical protein